MSAQLVDTSTSNQATWAPNLPTVFLASDGTALVFYYDGTEIKYKSAASPYTSWSSATILTGSSNSRWGMSALINNDDSVYLIYPGASNGAPYFNTLTKSGSTWSQGTRVSLSQSVTGGASGQPYGILKDSSGRLWFVYQGPLGNEWGAAYSSNAGASWTDSVTAQAMGNQTMLPAFCMAGSGRYVVVAYTKNDGSLYWRRCDTQGTLTSWSAEQSVAFGSGPDYYYTDYLSMAQDGSGRIVALMGDNVIGGLASGVWGKIYTPGTDTWGADTHLGTTTGGANPDGEGGVFAVSDGTNVYALYTQGAGANNSAIVFKKWSNGSGSWSGSATTLEASGNNNLLPNAFASSNTLAYAFTQGTASPYNIYFDTYATSTHQTHTASGVTAQVKAHKSHTATGVTAQVKTSAVTHTATGATAQIHAHPAHVAAGVTSQVKQHATHTARMAHAEVAKLPPLAPVISRGQPAYASDTSYPPANANDSDYGTLWTTGNVPSVGTPQYWAVDLSGVPAAQRASVILAWYTESGNQYYQTSGGTFNNVPRDYAIDVNAAAGGSYPATGWTTLVTVTGNYYWAREHALTLTGYNWVRISVTASSGTAPNNGVSFQVDIHDAEHGDYDDWLMLGDSITAEALYKRNPDGTTWIGGQLAQWVNARNGWYFPLLIDGGNPGQTMAWAATNISALLSGFTGHYVSIGFGTNDVNQAFQMSTAQIAAVYTNLLTIIDAVVAAGHTAVVPYVPYGTNNNGYLGINAQQLNAYVDAHLSTDRPAALRGADFYSAFYANQNLLRDGIHPTYTDTPPQDTGYDLWHRTWARWALATIYGTPVVTHTASGVTAQLSVTGGKTHQYHTASGVQAILNAPGQRVHYATGVTAQLKVHNTHTASGAAAQLKAHLTLTAAGVTAALSKHNVHTASGVLAQLTFHRTHSASGVQAQLHAPSVRHTASGVTAQIAMTGLPPWSPTLPVSVRIGSSRPIIAEAQLA